MTNFTGTDATVTASHGLSVSQRTPGNSSNRVITLEGNLEECDEVSITITWDSSNPGAETIIGDWSVELDGEKILILDAIGCDASGTGYVPVSEEV